MNDLTTNPADLGWPMTLPLEVALKSDSIQDICDAYGLSDEDWERLKVNPVFIAEVIAISKELKKDGMSFKLKARLQSEEFLKNSWHLVNNSDTPAAVKADMIKATWKAAGLEPTRTDSAGPQNAFQINIDLSGR